MCLTVLMTPDCTWCVGVPSIWDGKRISYAQLILKTRALSHGWYGHLMPEPRQLNPVDNCQWIFATGIWSYAMSPRVKCPAHLGASSIPVDRHYLTRLEIYLLQCHWRFIWFWRSWKPMCSGWNHFHVWLWLDSISSLQPPRGKVATVKVAGMS